MSKAVIERLGKIPRDEQEVGKNGRKNGFQIRTLGEVAQLISGQHIDAKDYNIESRGIGYLTGPSDFGLINPEVSKWTEFPKVKAKRDDILITVKGSGVGKINRLDLDEVVISRQLMAIRVNGADPSFVYAFLTSTFEHFQSESTGAAIPGISREQVLDLQIPIPSLPEQHRIVRILDEAFEDIAAAKANAEKNLQNARALFESHLQSVFSQRGDGWEEQKLSEICAITSMLIDPREKEFLDLVHVGAGNIESKTGSFVDLKTAREEGLISGKFLFDETMVLYSKIRPYLMKVARPEFKGLCSADMYPLVPKANKVTRDYLFHMLLSKPFTDYAIRGSARAGMPKVNREYLFEFKAWLPTVKKQKSLSEKLDRLHDETQRLEIIYQRKLAALDALEKSFLHQAFSGQLTSSPTQAIIPFPTKIPDISATDLHAGILAIAYQFHEANGKLQNYGHVKAEKIAHMIEFHLGIDLERHPVKDAAGPNDYPHLMRVEHRARKAGFFDFKRTESAGYRVEKKAHFDALILKTREKLGHRIQGVFDLMNEMVKMTTQQAEIFSTVYAAWNNLLLDGKPTEDEDIVLEARENWHPNKLNIDRDKFFKAIQWMKDKNLVPKGMGKLVAAKA